MRIRNKLLTFWLVAVIISCSTIPYFLLQEKDVTTLPVTDYIVIKSEDQVLIKQSHKTSVKRLFNDDESTTPWQEPDTPCMKECEIMLGTRYHSSARPHENFDYCKPIPSNDVLPSHLRSHQQQSHIQCGIFWELGSGTYCQAKNLYVDFNSLVKTAMTPDCRPEWPPYNPHETARWWAFPKGFISAAGCLLDARPVDGLLACVISKINNQTEVLPDSLVAVETQKIKQRIYSEPVITLITVRDEYANLYHQHAEWLNALFTMHLLNISRSECQVLLLDEHPSVPLDEFWNVVCAHGVKRVTEYKIDQTVTKLENAVIIPTAYSNVLNMIEQYPLCLDQCESKMIAHWRYSVLEYFQAPVHTYNASSIHITLLARRTTERNFNNLSEMQEIITSTFVKAGHQIQDTLLHFTFATHYFEDLSLKEQIAVISGTDMLIAMHGAGCTHVMYLPETSILLELSPFDLIDNRHFSRLAYWSGHEHHKCIANTQSPHLENCIIQATEKWHHRQTAPGKENKLVV